MAVIPAKQLDRLAAEFGGQGHLKVPINAIAWTDAERDSVETFLADSRELPPDSKGGGRRRGFMQFLLPQGDDRQLQAARLGKLQFTQSADLGSDHGDAVREMPSLPQAMQESGYLRALVSICCRFVRRHQQWSWVIAGRHNVAMNVHVITYVARPGAAAVATPDCPHRDGEAVTFMHVLEREGCLGGDTEIYANDASGPKPRPGALLFKAPLEAGEIGIVSDTDVWHHVTPLVCAPGCAMGLRTVVLVDFAPLVPVTFNIQGQPQTHLAVAQQDLARARLALAQP
jgi:hypothetical protein